MIRIAILFITAALAATPAQAAQQKQGKGQSTEELTVQQSKEYGKYVADAKGRALYLLESDSKGSSSCTDACAAMWPPLRASGDQPSAGDDAVRKALIGTTKRPDGSTQVTYNGHPLYYYAKDQGPGRATGQDVHDKWGEWYLVSPQGTQVEEGGK